MPNASPKNSIKALALAVAVMAGAAAAPPKVPQTLTVTIDKLAYSPATLNAHVGDTVVWTNKDVVRHTATAQGGGFDLDLKPGASGKTVLKAPGVVKYSCRYHPDMTGQIRVAPKP